ncbi:MAG: ABC transporter ATP-binding protein [Bacteroidales bacterium]|jgi:iron complex transport system ATP-binding protein|nr:ABC transporter ATP-binding protein [Bacteroidales bacterium]
MQLKKIINSTECLKENNTFLKLENLSVGYSKKTILADINLSADWGELIAIIGRNGIGKSTLMRTLARLQPELSGEILLAGKPLNIYTRNELAEKMSIVSTESPSVSHLTVRQLVAFGRFPYTNWIGKLTEKDISVINESMQLVGISHLADKNIYEISDGEKQRAMIARTLAQDTDLILLDEPTAFLDMPNKYEVIQLMHQLTRKKGKTIIFSTHDLNIAIHEADKFWLMINDQIFEGAPEDLIINKRLSGLFKGTGVQFDDHKGEFKIKKENHSRIYLNGEGKNIFWIRKALERIGYQVDISGSDFPDPDHAYISLEKNTGHWILKQNEQEMTFDSIYALSRFLSDHHHPVR